MALNGGNPDPQQAVYMAAEFIEANGNGEERVVQNGQRSLDEDSKGPG